MDSPAAKRVTSFRSDHPKNGMIQLFYALIEIIIPFLRKPCQERFHRRKAMQIKSALTVGLRRPEAVRYFPADAG
jgi:hypothetical protein